MKYLGFGFYYSPQQKQIRPKVHEKSIKRIKLKLKQLTKRNWSIELKHRLVKLKQVIIGWINYYKMADMKVLMIELDSTTRTRLRMCIWKSWETIDKRYKSLKKLRDLLKVKKTYEDLWAIANTRKGYMHTACHALNSLIQNKTLTAKGLVSMYSYYTSCLNAR